MVRPRGASNASNASDDTVREQELGSMYDYLAKIILLGPSGSGKSCLLHRFTHSTFRTLTSQTIGVEFASKIIRIGTGARRKRIKLQLWDTAGTERFRAVSRSYYRGAAGAILVYDLTDRRTLEALPGFLADARALASRDLSVLVVGNKADLVEEHDHDGQEGNLIDVDGQSLPPHTPSSVSSKQSFFPSSIGTSYDASSSIRSSNLGVGAQLRASTAPEGREVTLEEASEWARKNDIPVAVEVSALSGENVDEVFQRLARMILTKIELGEIDPDDPNSGIQYGDSGYGWGDDGGSVKSGFTADGTRRRRGGGGWGVGGLREWEEVFTLTKGARRRGGCC